MKKIILCSLIIAFVSTIVLGQQYTQTVRGTITDTDSKMSLPGVHIVILESDLTNGTVSDANGTFKFENVPIGRINLQFSFMGYESRIIPNIEVNSGKEVVLDINMQESAIKLDEVVIKANKKGEATNDMSILSARSIVLEESKRYTGGMDDPARVVTSFAGVTATADGSSDIIVRGNSPKYLQWRLDGIEISSPYHMNDQNASMGSLTALNNNLLATSDFYLGAFSAEYGNVLSGIMDIKLKKGNNERFEASCGLGLMGTNVVFEGPFKKGYSGSYIINYRYSTVSLLNQLNLIDLDGVVNYQDATFKVVLPTKKLGNFSFFGLAGLSGFSMTNLKPGAFTTPGSEVKDGDIRKEYDKDAYLSNFGFNHTLPINKNSYLKTVLSYSGTGMNDDIFDGNVIQGTIESDSIINRIKAFESQITTSTYRAAITYNTKLNVKNKIQAGVKYVLTYNNYNQDIYNSQTDALENVTDFNNSINAINSFINWKHRINEKFSFVAGVHNVNVLLNNKSTIEPRVAVNWDINNANSIHVGYGKHSTMESVHNYYTKVTLADGSVIEPNKNLDLLKADHYVLGYQKRFKENFRTKIEFFYQDLYNLPVENNDTSFYATINEGYNYRYVDLVNKGVGKNYGIELTIERFFDGNYYFLINGSLFESKYKSLEGNWRNTQYNGNYIVNILLGKEYKNLGKKNNKTLAINSKIFYGGGKKYIPLLRDAQGNLAVDPDNNEYWDYEKAYDNKLDDIFQLNLSISYKVNKQNVTHELFLDIMNLTNNQARLAEYYDETQPSNIAYLKQFQAFPNLMYRLYF